MAALRLGAHQVRVGQLLEVERERAGRNPQLFGQHAGREAIGAGHDQRTEGAQALHLGERGQRAQGLGFLGGGDFHVSIILEISNRVTVRGC
ncbi:hypothetical protein D9M69_637060 [compost metagenome]